MKSFISTLQWEDKDSTSTPLQSLLARERFAHTLTSQVDEEITGQGGAPAPAQESKHNG